MKQTFQRLAAAFMLAALAPLGALAQAPDQLGKTPAAHADHGAHAAARTAALTDGEVRKIDQDAGKLTIKHGEIKHMDMPPMTMVFVAKDKALLDKVKAGDKIRFMVVREGARMVVTDIQPAQ